MIRIANRDGSNYTSDLKEFKGSNTFAENHENYYVVYSYGTHFPMFIYDKINGNWIENTDKYSVTTSKYMGQLRPYYHIDWRDYNTYEMSTTEMKNLINKLENG